MKKLYRSNKDVVVAGVISGLANYISIDVAILRVLYGLFTLFSFGPGLVIYAVAALLIPRAPEGWEDDKFENGHHSTLVQNKNVVIGAIVVLFGISMMFKSLFSWLDLGLVIPIVLIAAGTYFISKRRG